MDYKTTLNLPSTTFPMKANLPQKEVEILKFWTEQRIYEKILKKREGKETFILHDGPPYANGHIHIGTAFNKILKDFVVKSSSMMGFYSPFVPGWDCHGMPIEHNVMKEIKAAKETPSIMEIRKRCRKYAEKFSRIQKIEFPRLGVLGDWDNPYLTMNPAYESKIIEGFREIVKNGYIYRGLRPIQWCPICKTALAEAEVEYAEHTSPSIYVKFPIIDFSLDLPTSFIIWTTTPWTLPANVAVAVHPRETYLLFKWKNELYIVAEPLYEKVKDTLGIQSSEILKKIRGSDLEGYKAKHPIFAEKTSVTILADFVDMETGTGCVHIAPGHGYEDYQVGLTYKLPVVSPVDDEGKFTDEVSFLKGKFVFDANEDILNLLREKATLLLETKTEHSYPHCWRCSNPLIFRATEQWFLNVDHRNLRERLLEAIVSSKWIPEWSRERIYNMVETRPDWTLSRQRAWGVPIPALYCKDCGKQILDLEVIDNVVKVVKDKTADSWFTEPIDTFLPQNFHCPHCNGRKFRRENDIFDVWFDASMSHKAVLEERDNLSKPADLYLEAVDQHRGWFQLSLIVSKTIDDTTPFKSVLTHGLILDANSKKMSKKLGNIVSPDDICKKYGADILRLWFASIDYTSDVTFGEEVLANTVEVYRKIRNTFRFLIGNLYDFKAPLNTVKYENLFPIDKLILSKLAKFTREIVEDYSNFAFNKVSYKYHNFCTSELSHYYFDIMKDRLYTYAKNSKKRRSTQTVFFELTKHLMLLISPILPFTAEEIWQNFPHFRMIEESIHISVFPQVKNEWINEELERKFEKLRDFRDIAYKALENKRKEKYIGNALEAKLVFYLKNDETKTFFKNLDISLAEYFIVSKVELQDVTQGIDFEEEDNNVAVKVMKALGEKCKRCWVYSETVGQFQEHPSLCKKCYDIIKECK